MARWKPSGIKCDRAIVRSCDRTNRACVSAEVIGTTLLVGSLDGCRVPVHVLPLYPPRSSSRVYSPPDFPLISTMVVSNQGDVSMQKLLKSFAPKKPPISCCGGGKEQLAAAVVPPGEHDAGAGTTTTSAASNTDAGTKAAGGDDGGDRGGWLHRVGCFSRCWQMPTGDR